MAPFPDDGTIPGIPGPVLAGHTGIGTPMAFSLISSLRCCCDQEISVSVNGSANPITYVLSVLLCCCLQRGLAPRVFEYLFREIDQAQDENVSRL
jgi:hypothetical protein